MLLLRDTKECYKGSKWDNVFNYKPDFYTHKVSQSSRIKGKSFFKINVRLSLWAFYIYINPPLVSLLLFLFQYHHAIFANCKDAAYHRNERTLKAQGVSNTPQQAWKGISTLEGFANCHEFLLFFPKLMLFLVWSCQYWSNVQKRCLKKVKYFKSKRAFWIIKGKIVYLQKIYMWRCSVFRL